MPILDQFVFSEPITVGQVTRVRVASHAQASGTLSATLALSEWNDVYFRPQKKSIAAKPNGNTTFTLERGSGDYSPGSVKLILTVSEAGVTATDGDDPLVEIR